MAPKSTFINKDYQQLLEAIPSGIVFMDKGRNEVFTNSTYSKLPTRIKKIIRNVDSTNPSLSPADSQKDYDLRFVKKEQGYYAIATKIGSDLGLANYTLETMVNAMKNTDDIYGATAKALSQCTGWRWASVTRFLADGKVEVLALWDKDHLAENYIYDIIGTPCELMASSKRMTFYSDLDGVFENNETIQKIGAKAYAGIVYYGADHEPVGHIMTMHDDREVDYGYTKEVFDLAGLALSLHLLHNQTKEFLVVAEKQANTDSLTGIYNRKAFDDRLNDQVKTSRESDHVTLLAIFDLDGLKAINDNYGHKVGDEFIQLFANELLKFGRTDDLSFRIGGDEFAAIFHQTTPAFLKVLRKRIDNALERIALVMSQNVGVSVGLASLSEADGNVQDWIKLADTRMYEEKSSK